MVQILVRTCSVNKSVLNSFNVFTILRASPLTPEDQTGQVMPQSSTKQRISPLLTATYKNAAVTRRGKKNSRENSRESDRRNFSVLLLRCNKCML